jgi:lincosamide nucleotidyltransferase A/C/D/E
VASPDNRNSGPFARVQFCRPSSDKQGLLCSWFVLANQVLRLLEDLRSAGFLAWIAGGWAVDAALGLQTRPHGDLDLAVDRIQLESLTQFLRDAGFRMTIDWLPARAEMTAEDGRRVDLHPVEFRADGSGVQAGLDGGPGFRYAPDAFSTGTIDGTPVPCLGIEQQLLFREGYELRDVDRHDLPLLRGLQASSDKSTLG